MTGTDETVVSQADLDLLRKYCPPQSTTGYWGITRSMGRFVGRLNGRWVRGGRRETAEQAAYAMIRHMKSVHGADWSVALSETPSGQRSRRASVDLLDRMAAVDVTAEDLDHIRYPLSPDGYYGVYRCRDGRKWSTGKYGATYEFDGKKCKVPLVYATADECATAAVRYLKVVRGEQWANSLQMKPKKKRPTGTGPTYDVNVAIAWETARPRIVWQSMKEARKYGLEVREVVNTATVYFLDGIRRQNPAYGYKTWASFQVRRAVESLVNFRRMFPLNRTALTEDDRSRAAKPTDTIVAALDDAETASITVRRLLAEIPPADAAVVSARFGLNGPEAGPTELAGRFNVRPNSVTRIVNRALAAMRSAAEAGRTAVAA